MSIMEALQQYVPHIWQITCLHVPGCNEPETVYNDYFCSILFGGGTTLLQHGLSMHKESEQIQRMELLTYRA